MSRYRYQGLGERADSVVARGVMGVSNAELREVIADLLQNLRTEADAREKWQIEAMKLRRPHEEPEKVSVRLFAYYQPRWMVRKGKPGVRAYLCGIGWVLGAEPEHATEFRVQHPELLALHASILLPYTDAHGMSMVDFEKVQ